MKTPSFLEIKILVEYLQDELFGSQLQEVTATENMVVLSFYRFDKHPKTCFLIFDLDLPYPFLALLNVNPWEKQKKTKPLVLFLKAHFNGKRLTKVRMLENLGRVLQFSFQDENKVLTLDFRMIPKACNLIATSGKNQISWSKIKPLSENYASKDIAALDGNGEDVRSISFLLAQWKRFRGIDGVEKSESGVKPENQSGGASTAYDKWVKQIEKSRIKKEKALLEIEGQIVKMNSECWSEVGEHLKVYGMNNLKPEWSIYLNYEKKAAENIKICFIKAKLIKQKISGAKERIEKLKAELSVQPSLQVSDYLNYLESKTKSLQVGRTDKKNDLKIHYRTLELAGGKVLVYLGKSAQDNIRLLKKSSPHDLWLHVKDYSSAHAFVRLQKNQKITDTDLYFAGQWLLKEGLKKKELLLNEKLVVLVAECRYVRPMKGDKLGRVTYHNAREVLIAV